MVASIELYEMNRHKKGENRDVGIDGIHFEFKPHEYIRQIPHTKHRSIRQNKVPDSVQHRHNAPLMIDR